MKIRGLLCGTTATTNEEYRKVLKRRNIWMIVLMLMGALIAGAAFYANHSQNAALPDYILGVYCGFGSGLILAGFILIVRNLILLGNEEKLKQSRLENSDERLQAIGGKAVRAAVMAVMLVGTAGGMIGGIYEPVLIKAMIFVLDLFLFTYLAAFVYYKRKM